MTKLYVAGDEVINPETFAGLGAAQLLAIYNTAAAALGEKPVNRFADRTSAFNRTAKIVERLPVIPETKAKEEPAEKGKAPKAEKPAKAPKEAGERAVRRAVFVFPFVEAKPAPREGSRRRILYDMLTAPEGATFDELHAATWATEGNLTPERQLRATYEGLRLMHFYCGYGMSQDADGRIRLITSSK